MITRVRNRMDISLVSQRDRPVPTSGDAFVTVSLKNQAADSLISTYRDSVRNFQGFVLFKVIPLNLPPHQSRDGRDGLIEK